MCVIICCRMRCTLVHYENLSRKAGDATNPCRFTTDVLRSWLPNSPAVTHSLLFCFVLFSLMRNKDMNYSPQCMHSLDPDGSRWLQVRLTWEGSTFDELPHEETGDPSIQEQCERSVCFTAERELLQFQAERGKWGTTTALYLPNISLSLIKLDFFRVCISLHRSQGWKHPSEKCWQRQRETQRYFSITGGFSRLQQNFSLLSPPALISKALHVV